MTPVHRVPAMRASNVNLARATVNKARNSHPEPKAITARIQQIYLKYFNFEYFKYLIFDANALPIVSVFILFFELILNILIVHRVPYTEIDWLAYMQECEGFLNGTTDYAQLKGDTGPLVYPAAFVYIYSMFYYLTNHGQNIRLAQYIFIGIYLLQMWLALRLYTKSRKIPPYVLVISAFTSYRIHSIFVLRLFNDPIAMVFVYGALNLFLDGIWTWGSICFSLAVGCKMNALLFAPALLLFYLTNLGYWRTFQQLLLCASVQILIGFPFLLTHPWAYLKGSFDLGRVFEHKWTVNYRFLPLYIFEHSYFHIALLLLHLILLILLSRPCWTYFQNYSRLRQLQIQLQPQLDRENNLNKSKTKKSPKNEKVSIHFDQCVQLALLPLLLCNFIGIICARSLHYQFYVWYFHSLPYLTWSTNYSLGLRYLILGLIELSWNTYPSTNFSSIILHFCHLLLFFGVCKHIFTTLHKTSTILQEVVTSTKSTEPINNKMKKNP